MFKAIKEFFFGKPYEAPKVEDKVEAVNAAPYKVEAPVQDLADVAVAQRPAPVEAVKETKTVAKKPAAPKAKVAPAKKPAAPKTKPTAKSLAKAGDKKQPAKKPAGKAPNKKSK